MKQKFKIGDRVNSSGNRLIRYEVTKVHYHTIDGYLYGIKVIPEGSPWYWEIPERFLSLTENVMQKLKKRHAGND